MTQLVRALNGTPDRTEAYRDWLMMYVATLTVASIILLLAG